MMSRFGFYIIFVTSLLIFRNMGFLDRLFGREKKTDQVTLTLPTESFAVVRADDAEKGKALMVINTSLAARKDDVQLKQVFACFCSVIFDYRDVDEELWPTQEEFNVMQQFTEVVDKGIKGDSDHPNALFVARVTNGGTCQVMWMLNDPDAAASYLDKMIADGSAVREFEYSIEGDPQWESIGWFLQDFSKNK